MGLNDRHGPLSTPAHSSSDGGGSPGRYGGFWLVRHGGEHTAYSLGRGRVADDRPKRRGSERCVLRRAPEGADRPQHSAKARFWRQSTHFALPAWRCAQVSKCAATVTRWSLGWSGAVPRP